MLNCIILDDEVLARTLLKEYIDQLDFLTIIGAFGHPLDAIPVLQNESIDIVFLDIQMPQMTGMEFAKLIQAPTQVIFTTAYAQYAVESYGLDALDYLLKPVEFPRFLQAVNKAKNRLQFSTSAESAKEKILTIKSGYDLHRVKYSDILYIQSDVNYVLFHTNSKPIMSHQSLKLLEKTLDTTIFQRVHRSYMVNKQAVTALKGKTLHLGNVTIPVSDRYYERVKMELF